MNDFMAMLYHKDGKQTAEQLDKERYDELKKTGEWFDSPVEAQKSAENDILKTQQKIEELTKKETVGHKEAEAKVKTEAESAGKDKNVLPRK